MKRRSATWVARGAGGAARDRGSVLVLVVGVLALMAMIVLVYSTIGISDRRGSAALVDKTRIAEQSQAVGDYLAQVIADSTTAVVSQRVNGWNGNQIDRLMRKAWDYPGAEWSVVSQADPAQPWTQFQVEGGIRYLWPSGQGEQRTGATPWLSTSEPVWLSAGQRALGSVNGAITGRGTADKYAGAYVEQFQDLRYVGLWAKDGRRISKLALRGNFDAEAGFEIDARGFLRTSADLFLLDASGTPTGVAAASLGGAALPWLAGVGADPNVPYQWSTNLFGVHRLVGSGVNASPEELQPGGRYNLDNVYADTDGDGFYDAPWFELLDTSEVLSGASPRYSVPQYGKLRWVVAAKAVDLSSLVNVNTALSFAGVPTLGDPPGATPADIDLQRLLALRDTRRLFAEATHSSGVPWYPNPPSGSPDTRSDYTSYDSPAGDVAEDVGGSAFASLLYARAYGTPPSGMTFDPGFVPSAPWTLDPVTSAIALDARARAYGYRAYFSSQLSASALAAPLGSMDRGYNAGFNIEDQLELFTYRGVNEPERSSGLEVTLDGRSRDRIAGALGPMRSNRKSDYERMENSGPESQAQAALLLATSARADLTTVSGARDLRTDPTGRTVVARIDALPGGLSLVTPLPLDTKEVRPDMTELLEKVRANQLTDATVYTIFDGYVSALLPEAGRIAEASSDRGVWDAVRLGNQVLSYGHNMELDSNGVPTPNLLRNNAAEIALRTAATMTVNLVAERLYNDWLLNTTFIPADSLVTANLYVRGDQDIVLDNVNSAGGFPTQSSNATGQFDPDRPYATLKLDADEQESGGTVRRLATAPVAPTLDAKSGLVLYGVRPQPFLTQAAYFVMYSNAPGAGSGNSRDKEWDDSSNPITPGPATIYGEVDPSNDDFLMEVFAVQVTNPFDRPIALTDAKVTDAAGHANDGSIASGDDTFRYYVEFNGRFFKIMDGGMDGTEKGAVSLAPYESRVFYYSTEDLRAISLRWSAVSSTVYTADDVRLWIEHQLRTYDDPTRVPRALPVRMVEMDRTTGVNTPGAVDLFGQTPGHAPEQERVVRLWRRVFGNGENPGANTDWANDYLVDRLRDPVASGVPSLNAQLPSASGKLTITGSSVLPPFAPGTQTAYDNTRYSVTTYGSIRRPDDPSAAAPLTIPRGVFPAYTIEAKSNGYVDNSTAVQGVFIDKSYNKEELRRSTSAAAVPESFFTTSGASRLDGSAGLIKAQTTGAGILPSITISAHTRYDPLFKIPDSLGPTLANDGDDFNDLYVPIRAVPVPRNLRATELLGPLAVGAWFDPAKFALGGGVPNTATAAPERAIDIAWFTLSEALALGTNYTSARNTLAPGDSSRFFLRFADPKVGVVSRGQVVLDRYVIFNDSPTSALANGVFDQIPGPAPSYLDPSRGMGIPLAWNIVNNFRVSNSSSLRSMAHGLVNINTAPRAVLSLLPMLTPDYENPNSSNQVNAPWTQPGQAKFRGSSDLWDPAAQAWDVAATILAYRDKNVTYARGLNLPGVAILSAAMDFTDNNAGVQDQRTFLTTMTDTAGRRNATGFGDDGVQWRRIIQPLREEPGFMSPIEVLAARLGRDFVFAGPAGLTGDVPPADVPGRQRRADLSVDRLGRLGELPNPPTPRDLDVVLQTPSGPDTGASAGLTQAWVLEKDTTDPARDLRSNLAPRPNQVPSGQEAKLALASALMNSVTVRSDVFAVWFVIEGYSRGDVEDLNYLGSPTAVPDPFDDSFAKPMVPTVSRRYLMIVDRSNVTALGQRPRVLMVQELPR